MSNRAENSGTQAGTAADPPTVADTPPADTTESSTGHSESGKVKIATVNPAALWLRRGDHLIVSVMAAALLVLLGIHWLRLSHWGNAPVELSSQQPREYYYSLDVNTASWVEWAQLDGIGEKLARRIVADREERGPFRNAADVGRVRGIGPKLLEKIHPFLRGGTEHTPTP